MTNRVENSEYSKIIAYGLTKEGAQNYTQNPWSSGQLQILLRGGVIFMAEMRKSTKKVAENRKKGKNSAENRKKKCAGNRKMTFLSHGKPENLKIFAENGKLFFKAAETGNHF